MFTPGKLLLRDKYLFLPPLAITFALCLWGSSKRQLWRDEHATWWAASLSLPDLWRLLQNVDFVISPFYLFMRAWVAVFGDSPFALRLPSAIAMTAAAGLMTALARRMFDDRAGILAGLIFAFVPSVSAFGQEARPYAFALACSLAATWCLYRALERPDSIRRWFSYGAGVVGAGGFHIVSVLLLVTHGVAVCTLPVSSPRRDLLRRWLVVSASAIAALSALAYVGSQQSGQISWITADAESLLAFPAELFSSEIIAGMIVSSALLALPKSKPHMPTLVAWTLFAPTFLLAFSAVLHLFLPRYMLFTLPGWILLAARQWSNDLTGRYAWLLPTIALLAIFSLDSHRELVQRTPGNHYDYKTAALDIQRQAQPGDAIAFEGPRSGFAHIRLAFRYILRKNPNPPRDVFAIGTAEQVGNWIPALCPDAKACLTADTQRLWLVTTAPRHSLFEGMPEDRARLLEEQFELRTVRSVPKLRYALFIRRLSDRAVAPGHESTK